MWMGRETAIWSTASAPMLCSTTLKRGWDVRTRYLPYKRASSCNKIVMASAPKRTCTVSSMPSGTYCRTELNVSRSKCSKRMTLSSELSIELNRGPHLRQSKLVLQLTLITEKQYWTRRARWTFLRGRRARHRIVSLKVKSFPSVLVLKIVEEEMMKAELWWLSSLIGGSLFGRPRTSTNKVHFDTLTRVLQWTKKWDRVVVCTRFFDYIWSRMIWRECRTCTDVLRRCGTSSRRINLVITRTSCTSLCKILRSWTCSAVLFDSWAGDAESLQPLYYFRTRFGCASVRGCTSRSDARQSMLRCRRTSAPATDTTMLSQWIFPDQLG